jgi:hypothetical protein
VGAGRSGPGRARATRRGVARAIEAIECAIAEGVDEAMQRYNRDDGGSAEGAELGD